MNAERVRHRLAEDPLIYLPAIAGCCAFAGLYIGQTGSLMPLVALGALGGLMVAIVRPRFALALGLAAMALPYTWGPQTKLGFGSGIVVGLLLLIAFAPILTRFQPSALDVAVLAFAWTPAATAAFQGQAFHITAWLAPEVVFPYFGFRLLFHAPDACRVFATVIVVIGVIVASIGIWEGLTGHNPIVAAGTNTYTAGHYTTTWNHPDYRDGHLRALSTFGHPIAFGMFLLIPLAFALARRGPWNLAAAGIILIAVALTFSRGPWIGCLVVVVLLAGWNRRRILITATAIAAAAIFVGPVNHVLAQSTSAATEAGQNTYYRVGLLSQAFHNVSWLGQPFGDLQSAIPNYADVTSLVAMTLIQTGIVGLIELATIACLAITALVNARRHGDHDYQAATAALTAQLVGLSAVTLITNYQFFFWVLLAYVATLRQIHSRERGDNSL